MRAIHVPTPESSDQDRYFFDPELLAYYVSTGSILHY